MSGQTWKEANFPKQLNVGQMQPTRTRIGFTLVPFKLYGRWKWLFYRYAEAIMLPTDWKPFTRSPQENP